MNNSEELLTNIQEQWIPRTHCSNCAHCIVYKKDYDPTMVRCNKNYGKRDKPLIQLISIGGKGWMQAVKCPSYEPMGDVIY